ncbi:MAG: tRNA lysidine(34) synthetase TilS [Janthinobacterium lividum]
MTPPVTRDEFAALMAPLGPWGHGRPFAVAVSGGADSLCLAWLAAAWGDARALVVDHGLRPESADEAAATAAVLAGLGIPARTLPLHGLPRGPALAERARRARYAALLAACAEAGLADLLLGHHAADQAETVLMRRLSGSGPDGLAGMAPLSAQGPCRLLRPLLAIAPDRLRATLRHAGLAWIEDPSNRDPAALRTRLRHRLAASGETAALLAAAAAHALRRHAAETATAVALARIATFRPEGFAVLSPGPWPPAALSAALRTVGARAYPPDAHGVARLAASPRPATLGGVRLLPAGRLGSGWLLVREAAAMALPVAAHPGATWDARFRILGEGDPTLTLGALGPDAGRSPRDGLPAVIRATLPALRRDGRIVSIPHESGADDPWHARVRFDPPGPALAAPFDPAGNGVTQRPEATTVAC